MLVLWPRLVVMHGTSPFLQELFRVAGLQHVTSGQTVAHHVATCYGIFLVSTRYILP